MNLKEKRRECGMTQMELAKRVGIWQSSVTRFENGKVKPRVATAKRIASVLGFDWTEFYKEDTDDRGEVSGAAEEAAERMGEPVPADE